ncbi:sigma factor-like helix-turn-helix DNA-binding protein [Kribbella sp. NPDC056861]|uniref:RNA polymerase sigma factor n=1 Tax=Kribbella sp. NPDC056861 TaxID=3154857 RepID=UPI00342EB3B4
MPRSSRPPAGGTDGWADDRRELLEVAGAGDPWAVGQLCDRHGGALFALARAVLGDSQRAEDVVVEVIARACVDPGATASVRARSLRRELARLTYLYAARCLDDTSRPGSGSVTPTMAGLAELARQQRSAVALIQCGDHTIGDVADLLDLSVSAVATLLCAGLQELSTPGKSATGHGPRLAEDRPV